LLDLLQQVQVLVLDEAAARRFEEVRAWQLDRGLGSPDLDLFNAAIALVNNLTLVTHNVQDYASPHVRRFIRQHSMVWIELQLVTFFWLNVRDFGKYGIEFVPAASLGALLQILHGCQRRELLGYGGGNELVHGNAVLLGTLFQLLVYGIWQSKAQRRTHGTTPIIRRNSMGRIACNPKRSMSRKSRSLKVTM
jgi:hypothetical protein